MKQYHQHSEHATPNRKYQIWCHDCGWHGCSCQVEGGEYNAMAGDYDDIYCPECDSQNLDEHEKPRIRPTTTRNRR